MDVTATVTLVIRVPAWGPPLSGVLGLHVRSNSLSIVPWGGGQSMLDVFESRRSQRLEQGRGPGERRSGVGNRESGQDGGQTRDNGCAYFETSAHGVSTHFLFSENQ